MAEYFGATVADIFNTMPERFKPEEARTWILSLDMRQPARRRQVTATIKHGTLKVEKSKSSKMQTTIHADAENFCWRDLGKITAIDALTSRKLRVVGDARLLMTLLPKIFVPFTVTPRKRRSVPGHPGDCGIPLSSGKGRRRHHEHRYDLTVRNGGQWTLMIKDGDVPSVRGLRKTWPSN